MMSFRNSTFSVTKLFLKKRRSSTSKTKLKLTTLFNYPQESFIIIIILSLPLSWCACVRAKNKPIITNMLNVPWPSPRNNPSTNPPSSSCGFIDLADMVERAGHQGSRAAAVGGNVSEEARVAEDVPAGRHHRWVGPLLSTKTALASRRPHRCC